MVTMISERGFSDFSSDEMKDNVAALPAKRKKIIKTSKRNEMYQMSGTIIKLTGRSIVAIPSRKVKKYEKCFGFDLSNNRIDFTDELCSDFQFIRYLNLSHNKLNSLPQDIHLMQNLIHFDISDNNIQTLPLGIKDLKNLVWLDLRGNPFVERWNKFNHFDSNRSFDPRDVKSIVSFMEAVKCKHDLLVRDRAKNFRDFTLICPRKPSKNFLNWKFGEEEKILEKCPFHDFYRQHPEVMLETLTTLDDCQAKIYSYPEKWTWILLKAWPSIAGNLFLILLLSAAFYDDAEFQNVLSYFDNVLPSWTSNFLKNGRTTVLCLLPQSITNFFPIQTPL